ncbi:unnamed protein product [Lactuca saligna]|uniref:Uncharacterized protein n=1 Tax=Lactuca saligna TaxID=75948 RepID=A0AA35ULZ4_LACSI|nr:unnamed protein product [Lactuca saligna]
MALFFGLLKEASNYLQLIIRDIVDVTASNPSICSIVDRFTVTTLVQEQWTNSLLAYPHFLCCFKLDPCAIENASSAASNPTFSRNPFHLTFTASSRCVAPSVKPKLLIYKFGMVPLEDVYAVLFANVGGYALDSHHGFLVEHGLIEIWNWGLMGMLQS